MSAKVEFYLGLLLIAITCVWTYFAYSAWGLELFFMGITYTVGGILLTRAAYRHYRGQPAKFWVLWVAMFVFLGLILPQTMRSVTTYRFRQEQRNWP